MPICRTRAGSDPRHGPYLAQNDPETEVVYTTRLKRDGEHPLKLLLTKFGYRFIKSISDIQLPVDSGDFKLLSRRAVSHLLGLKEDKPYIRGLVSYIGFKQVPVYYNREARFDGQANTKFPVLSKRVLYGYLDRALISFSGCAAEGDAVFRHGDSSIASMLYIFVVLFQKLMGTSPPGFPAEMCAILLIGGIQMMMLGFVGLYVGAIFRETRGRPRYIVKEVLRIKLANDRHTHPLPYFILRRRHGLSLVVSGRTRRRRARDQHRQILLHHLPPSAAWFFEHRHRIVYSKIETVKNVADIKHPSARAVVLGLEDQTQGFEIHHDGDLPARSGLGTSSSFTVGLVHALNALRGRYISKEQLASLSIHIEQDIIKETVGSQDQVSAAFGGLNRIEFRRDGTFQVDPW